MESIALIRNILWLVHCFLRKREKQESTWTQTRPEIVSSLPPKIFQNESSGETHVSACSALHLHIDSHFHIKGFFNSFWNRGTQLWCFGTVKCCKKLRSRKPLTCAFPYAWYGDNRVDDMQKKKSTFRRAPEDIWRPESMWARLCGGSFFDFFLYSVAVGFAILCPRWHLQNLRGLALFILYKINKK